MPTLDDLNEIKSNLLSLGDEPGILAEKGEVPVDIGPPETGLSDDLNELFNDFEDVEEETESLVPDSSVPELVEGVEGFKDFDLDLDDEPAFDMDGFDEPEPDSSDSELLEEDIDGFDINESDSEVPELVEGAEGDLDFGDEFDESDLEYADSPESILDEEIGIDEPDTPEPDSAIPELDEGDLNFGEEFDESDLESADSPESILDEQIGIDEPDLNFGDEFDDSDLKSADSVESLLDDEIEVDIPESGSAVPEQFDELTVPLVEGELDDDLGFEDLVGITDSDENLNFEDDAEDSLSDFSEEVAVDDLSEDAIDFDDELDLSSSDDFDLGEDSELAFDDSDDFDLSGEELAFDDTGDSDNFGLSSEELAIDDIDLGVNEKLSLDDSDADSMDLDEFEISDESFDEDLEIDEFDLGDLGQDFGVLEEDLSSVSEPELSPEDSSLVEEDLEEEEYEIEEKSFVRVKNTLKNLPRNLKLIIEEEIGEKGLKGPSLKKLIDALSEGKTPKEIASITSKIVGKKIKISANYSKQTGIDYEEEKGSFQYALIHKIFPLVKIFLISSIIIAGVSFAAYKFIYKPIHAYVLYNRGYEQLEESNYNRSADLFDQAFNKYKMKKQFYRYAEGYIESNQWAFARSQYDKLLVSYPFDKKGTIDYATMEFEKLSDYEHSSEILNNFLEEDKHKRDYEALFLLGDIYLEWGWENYDKYEDAWLAYAKIMSSYGIDDKILFRMLKYFIRTDNAKEVEILKNRFQIDTEKEIDPLAYAELAGYQIDRHDLNDVQDMLFRAKDVDGTIPEIHYQLARLFNITGEGVEEDKALNKTLNSLDKIQTLNRRGREIKIDSFRRQGERFYIKEEYLQSEEAYSKGIDLLNESRERNIIKGTSSIYGQLYADLAHIYYYISENQDNALDLYETAEGEGFSSPEIFYNKGNIRYRRGDFRQALLEFYKSAGSFSVNTNLLHATANTLYQRNDFFAAQGYYNHLLDLLEMKLSREFSIRIDEREDHRMMVESLMKAYNNMGVTLYGLYERTGDPSKFSAAILSFTQSNEYFDDLTRDPETLNRTDMINLASLNQRKMLYPIPDYELQIFADIPKRLDLR